MLEILDGVGAVGPAVGVDDAVGDALDHAVNRVTKILRGRQHRGEQDEQRERDLNRWNRQYFKNAFNPFKLTL